MVRYYIAGTDKPSKVRAFQHAKSSTKWTPGDENTAYYLKRLQKFADRFKMFLAPEDFARVFSDGVFVPREMSLFGDALPPPDFSGTKVANKYIKPTPETSPLC